MMHTLRKLSLSCSFAVALAIALSATAAGIENPVYFKEINPLGKPTGKVCIFAYSAGGVRYGNELIGGGGGASSYKLTPMGDNWVKCTSANEGSKEKILKKIELASAQPAQGNDYYPESSSGSGSGGGTVVR
jgi:hypothetical protein